MGNIGILTWHYYENFGSALQAYALQTKLEAMGYQVKIVNYRNPKYGKGNPSKDWLRNVFHFTFGNLPGSIGARFRYCFLAFHRQYFHETEVVYDIEAVNHILAKNKISALVYGSDQIWAPNCFNPVYFGESVDGRKIPKISYAASVGLREIPRELQEKYQALLSDFLTISVRESDGKTLLNKIGIENVSVVLDPTLLLDKQDCEALERKPYDFPDGDYVFCYFLNKDHTYRTAVEKLAQERNLPVWVASAAPDDAWMHSAGKIGPREFLYYIRHAKAVITDSYHGAIFSLLYHKELHIFERFSEENPINQNSRIEQLRRWFELENCIVPGTCPELPKTDYDYSMFEEKRTAAKKISLDYLEESLHNAFIYQG